MGPLLNLISNHRASMVIKDLRVASILWPPMGLLKLIKIESGWALNIRPEQFCVGYLFIMTLSLSLGLRGHALKIFNELLLSSHLFITSALCFFIIMTDYGRTLQIPLFCSTLASTRMFQLITFSN